MRVDNVCGARIQQLPYHARQTAFQPAGASVIGTAAAAIRRSPIAVAGIAVAATAILASLRRDLTDCGRRARGPDVAADATE